MIGDTEGARAMLGEARALAQQHASAAIGWISTIDAGALRPASR